MNLKEGVTLGLLGLILVMVGTNSASFAIHNEKDCHTQACNLIKFNNFLISKNNCLLLSLIENTTHIHCLTIAPQNLLTDITYRYYV